MVLSNKVSLRRGGNVLGKGLLPAATELTLRGHDETGGTSNKKTAWTPPRMTV